MVQQFVLQPGALSMDLLKQIHGQPAHCVLDSNALGPINAARDTVRSVLQTEKIVYGINTGFGLLAHQRISSDKLEQLQRNVILSHACGTGPLLNDEVVALILLLKINNLAQGYSGVSLEVIDALCQLYNAGVYPCIPSKGSVGASGDLVPLAHLSLTLLGEGDVRYQGQLIPAKKGLSIGVGCPSTHCAHQVS